MTPTWNIAESTARQKCSCLNLDQALCCCLKFGPVALIRLKVEQGETLSRIEAGHFLLGHQFTFQSRTYEIRCLVTVNRTDQDSPLLVIQAGQTGNISVYDHNNGLRVLDSSRINNKLFIVGELTLQSNHPTFSRPKIWSQLLAPLIKQVIRKSSSELSKEYSNHRGRIKNEYLDQPRRTHICVAKEEIPVESTKDQIR